MLKRSRHTIKSGNKKPVFQMMRESVFVNRNKMFSLNGIVKVVRVELAFSSIQVIAIDFEKSTNNEELYMVYFVGNSKAFVDRHVNAGNIVDVFGELGVSTSKSTKGAVVLKGKNVYVYDVDLSDYDDKTLPDYIDPNDIKDAAF